MIFDTQKLKLIMDERFFLAYLRDDVKKLNYN